MEPIVHGLQKQFKGQVKVVQINREDPENADIVAQYDVRSQPTFFMVNADGDILWKWQGYMEGAQLEQVFLSAADGTLHLDDG